MLFSDIFDDDGDTAVNDDFVLENDNDHHLRHHPRCGTHSNHCSFRRVVIATVSAAAVTLRCCRDASQLAVTTQLFINTCLIYLQCAMQA